MRQSWERVYRRLAAAKHAFVAGRKSTSFRPLVVGKQFSLAAATAGNAASSGTTPIDFSSGACILTVSLGVSNGIGAAAITQTLRDLMSSVRFSLEYPSGEGLLTTGGPLLASSVFGADGAEQFPPDFIILERGGTLQAVVQNLTTSAIIADLAFHAMVPR